MRSRRHGGKPTLALWLLIALLDVALLAAAAGPVLFVLVTAALGGAVLGGRSLWWRHRRPWHGWAATSRTFTEASQTFAGASRRLTAASQHLAAPRRASVPRPRTPVNPSPTFPSRAFAGPSRRLAGGS
jgi:hypothetical protein